MEKEGVLQLLRSDDQEMINLGRYIASKLKIRFFHLDIPGIFNFPRCYLDNSEDYERKIILPLVFLDREEANRKLERLSIRFLGMSIIEVNN